MVNFTSFRVCSNNIETFALSLLCEALQTHPAIRALCFVAHSLRDIIAALSNHPRKRMCIDFALRGLKNQLFASDALSIIK